MYIGYNRIYCVCGKVVGDTLITEDQLKLPIKQNFEKSKTGFIQFIREASGVCDILRIVEQEF